MARTKLSFDQIFAATGLLTGILGFLAYGTPAAAEASFQGIQIFGTFLIFLFFSVSAFSWGRIFSRFLGFAFEVWSTAALGIGGAAATAMVLGHLGLIGPSHRILLTALLFLGPGINVFSSKNIREPIFSVDKPHVFEIVSLALIAASVLLFVIAAFYPNPFYDPLWCNALAPRRWSNAGKIFFDTKSIIGFQSSYWEYLYLWGNSLLSGAPGEGLIACLLFGQWTHAFWGYGGTVLALWAFLAIFCDDRFWLGLAVFSGLCVHSFQKMAMIAKNDWGICFWLLAGFALLLSAKELPRKQLAAAGALIGLGLGGKFTAVFSVVPLFLLWAYVDRQVWKKAPIVFSALLLGLVPILLRNWLATGNPVFPSMNLVFKSAMLGPSWTRAMRNYDGTGIVPAFSEFSRRLTELLRENPLLPAGLAFPLSLVWPKKRSRLLTPLWLTLAGSFIFFAAKIGPAIVEMRYLGLALNLWAGFSVLSIAELGSKARWLALPLLALITYTADIPWKAPWDLLRMPSTGSIVRQQPNSGSLAWLRANTKPDDVIVSLLETRLYYLDDRNIRRVWDDPEWDAALSGETDPLKAVVRMRALHAKYLLATIEVFDQHADKKVSDLIIQAILANPRSVVFAAEASKVIDLERMEKALRQR
ncbi:MAG: hypothetical protein HY074_18070 [Deltaproteobacteria bacterium]|nr:hypothetical protein [Deltaproteobacteria bacterium]